MELKVLNANDGMILTNGEAYGKSITLGKNDNESNWYEITEAEYQKIIEAQRIAEEEQTEATTESEE